MPSEILKPIERTSELSTELSRPAYKFLQELALSASENTIIGLEVVERSFFSITSLRECDIDLREAVEISSSNLFAYMPFFLRFNHYSHANKICDSHKHLP